MSTFTVQRAGYQPVTCISDDFIENWMPQANGAYVKVYLYLLCALKNNREISVSGMADLFQCTESDIQRAFRYWEKEALLELSTDSDQQILGLTLKDPKPVSQKHISIKENSTESLREPKTYSMDELSNFQQQPQITQLLFVCEQYLRRPLGLSEINDICFFYDGLQFSTDLIEYLIEYSVSRNKFSFRYIRSVAFSWKERGITTVEQAKSDSKPYRKECYQVLKALGINNHDPLPREEEFVKRWLAEYHFTIDIIIEACTRTMMQIHKPEFHYVEKILKEWSLAGVKHFDDIATLDARRQKQTEKAEPERNKSFTTRLHNFDQRSYDFNELEKKLFINS